MTAKRKHFTISCKSEQTGSACSYVFLSLFLKQQVVYCRWCKKAKNVVFFLSAWLRHLITILHYYHRRCLSIYTSATCEWMNSLDINFLFFLNFFISAGLDTRLTSCVAHDGSHDSHQDLLDADGCSLDTNILPNVQEKILSRSSTETTKLLFAVNFVFLFCCYSNFEFDSLPAAPRCQRLLIILFLFFRVFVHSDFRIEIIFTSSVLWSSARESVSW